MVVRGGNEGGLDGIDVWGTNIWVHDVEVTNKDECVTVKVGSGTLKVQGVLLKYFSRVQQAISWWRISSAIGQVDAPLDRWEQIPVILSPLVL